MGRVSRVAGSFVALLLLVGPVAGVTMAPAAQATGVPVTVIAGLPGQSNFPLLGDVPVVISPVPDGGNVQLYVDGIPEGAPVDVSTVDGHATIPAVQVLSAGDYTFTVHYTGTPGFNSAVSSALPWVVHAAPTTTTVSVDPPSSYVGDFANVFTQVSPIPDGGQISITLDGVVQPVKDVVTAAGFTVFGPFTSLTAGDHTVSATFLGTANYTASQTAAALTFHVYPKGKPGAPTGVTGTRGNGQVVLSWTEPALDGGHPVSGYVVTPYLGAGAQPPTTFVGTLTSHTVTGLTNGLPYTFKVAAQNSAGTGPQSAASAPLTPASAPGVPTAVSAVGGNGTAALTWTAPTDNGGTAVTGYRITPYRQGVAQSPLLVNSPATSHTVSGLANGTAYRFKVAAINAVGTGAASALSGVVVPPFASLVTFTQRQYHDFLGRSASGSEEVSLATSLNGGALPAAPIAALRKSTDATTKVDPTTRLYFAYFLRIPDQGGLTYWIGRSRGGTSLYAISDFFAASAEFKATYGALNNAQFVNLVYQNVLGRPGDQGGIDYWTSALDSHAKTRGQVMVGYSESSEYKAKEQPSVDVAVTWIDMLGASPDQASFDLWVTRLTTGGQTVADLATALLADPRYLARLG